jgi:adenylosuccinate lyase
LKNKNWTSKELKTLLNSRKIGYKNIAKNLNRSGPAVLHKLHMLMIGKKGFTKGTKYHQTSTVRNILSNYRKNRELKKKLRQIFKNTKIRNLDKITDINR